MSKLISNHVLRATESNMLKNDCPLNCNKQYCTDCQFREKSSKVTQNKKTIITPSPEVYGRDLYH